MTKCLLCGSEIEYGATYTDVCDRCGMVIAGRYRERLVHEVRQREQAQFGARIEADRERIRREKQSRPPFPAWPEQLASVVYYVAIGDLVKIGYSASLIPRLKGLRATREDVLAIEEGGRPLEDRRHQQFAHLRVDRRENFRRGDDLMEHIATLGGRDALPVWLTSKPTRRSKYATPVVARTKGGPLFSD